jgi:hypothetical protein
MSVTITPSNASSRIMISLTMQVASSSAQGFWKIQRGTTDILVGDTAGSRTRVTGSVGATEGLATQTACITIVDSPATASAVTYKIVAAHNTGGGSFMVNQCASDSDSAARPRAASVITAMEIKG